MDVIDQVGRINLDACAREPIHILGNIQSHGALLAADGAGVVRQCSSNLQEFLGLLPAEALDRPLSTLLGRGIATWADSTAADSEERPPLKVRRHRIARTGLTVWLRAHRRGGMTIVEMERAEVMAPAPDSPDDRPALSRILHERNLYRACQDAADLVQAVAGYDRVMVYMFHPDMTGEVVAEARSRSMASYLGLRYPASDIPAQARRLYLEARLRQVVDIHSLPVPIEPLLNPQTGQPLDLGLAHLRSLSPVHIEYLANMGVTASLTLSVIVDGALWGLIACHHTQPFWLDPDRQQRICRVADALARSIRTATRRLDAQATRQAARQFARLQRVVARSRSPLEDIILSRQGLLNAIDADGVALVAGRSVLSTGAVPEADWLRQFARILADRAGEASFVSECLGRDVPDLPAPGPAASGCIAQLIDPAGPVVIAAFAGEVGGTVNWGGNPDKPVEWDPAKGRLSPRKSFELWKQQLRGHTRPWRRADIRLIADVGRLLTVDQAGNPDGMVREIERVSRRLGGEKQVRREILDVLLDGIVLVASIRDDNEMKVHAVNRLFRDVFGISGDKRLPHRLETFLETFGLPPELADPAFTDFPMTREVWSSRRGRRWFSFDRRTVFNAQGESGGTKLALICLYDVTAYKQAEEALMAARQQAISAMEQQRKFIAAASHELRTPLNAIIGFSEMIQMQTFGPVGDTRYQEYATDILNAGRHLLDLINDILTLGRMQPGAAAAADAPVCLNDEIRQALRMVEDQARARSIAVVWEEPPYRILLDMEARAVRQILLNLLSNAVKFTPPGGQVSVVLGGHDGEDLWLEISDTGIGIAEADMEHVFEPFFRAGNVYTRSTEGTGLGLSIVRALMEAHGGRVSLRSRYGQGTTLRITLPSWRLQWHG
ncbi:ATP-binding protein [Rhodospirillum centenum]|uniref:histidine kinase n=1 Tax=Rhodospirillum centenum (strain ATCC 51521 / SW) TaxID=414684 RepID=B6IXX2_RHOCS|nr:ATP-binding protein [Rhodospirillum centenum]ACJ01146.1 histidine protein kinase DivJ (or putative bacteriophytochrome) [Rhodospirillum centenum SW]